MEDCIFCKIARHEIPSEVVYENDTVIGFRDISPMAPVHILIIPKEHINPKIAVSEEEAKVVSDIFLAAREIAKQEEINERGFRIISNTGDDSGQEVEHLHFHVLGGKKLGPMVHENSK